MVRNDPERLQQMLLDPDRLGSKERETARRCLNQIMSAAEQYEPKKKDRPQRSTPYEVQNELKALSQSINEVQDRIYELCGDTWLQLETAMLPKAELTISGWEESRREVLSSWLGNDGSKLQDLSSLAEAVALLVAHVGKQKESGNGTRAKCSWHPKPQEILLFIIAEAALAVGQLSHAKQIGDVVHQWKTDDDPDNCLSERAWRNVQCILQNPGKWREDLQPHPADKV